MRTRLTRRVSAVAPRTVAAWGVQWKQQVVLGGQLGEREQGIASGLECGRRGGAGAPEWARRRAVTGDFRAAIVLGRGDCAPAGSPRPSG